MQHTHINNGNTFLFWDCDGSALALETIEKRMYQGLDIMIISEEKPYNLPAGKWLVMGKGNLINEEQAKEIVIVVYIDEGQPLYACYDSIDCYQSAIQSLQSLLRSLSLKPEQCLILKKI